MQAGTTAPAMARTNQLFTIHVVNYVAMMTAEILSTTNYTTADQIGVGADGVPDLVLPWALELERIEQGVLAEFPDLFDFAGGVWAYEVVEPIAQELYQLCRSDQHLRASIVPEVVLKHFISSAMWELPEEVINCATRVAHQVQAEGAA